MNQNDTPSNEKKYIQVSIRGYNTPKGYRKPRSYFFDIAKIENMESRDLSALFETAKAQLARMNKVESCSMVFNHAKEDGEMRFISLMPIETLKVI